MIDESGVRIYKMGPERVETNETNRPAGQKIPATRKPRGKPAERISAINTFQCRFNVIRTVAGEFGMKESADNWDVLWTDMSITVERCKELKRYQRINHFPGMLEICRKDLLARNLNRMLRLFPDEFNFFPKTWCLRTDLLEVLEYSKNHKEEVFIMKPSFGCQGKGIAITNNVSRLKNFDDMICQVYIQRPFLIDGYKFDLRVYALITSCNPLRIFVYNEGLARFATAKYRMPNSINASNMFMHLTNYSVNKHSRAYIVDDIDGSKRRLSTINQWFWSNNYDVKQIWNSIDDVIIKTITVSLPTVRHYYQVAFPHQSSSQACFEILGFDFIFDHCLKPYILEVNHSPSFGTDTAIDHEVKAALLYDAFNILDLQHTNREDVLLEEKRRAWERLFSASQTNEVASRERAHDEKVTQNRIAWENSHLGNFRKIYPCRRIDSYERFTRPISSVFSATCSSRAKEHVGMRMLKNNFAASSKLKVTSRMRVKRKLVDTPALKTRAKQPKANGFEPCLIDELEEIERQADLRNRESLLRIHGIFDKLYDSMRNAGLLNDSDVKLHRKLSSHRQDEKDSDEISISVDKALEIMSKPSGKGSSCDGLSWKLDKIGVSTRMACPSMLDTKSLSSQSCWIDASEESERLRGMELRQFLVESHGLRELIREQLKVAGMLQTPKIITKTSKPRKLVHTSSEPHQRRIEKWLEMSASRPAKTSQSERRIKSHRRPLQRHKSASSKIPNPSEQLRLKMRVIHVLRSLNGLYGVFGDPKQPPRKSAEDSPEWSTPTEEVNEPKIHKCWRNPFFKQK